MVVPGQVSGYRSVRPPHLVEVFEDGGWCRAQLEGWRETPHALLALVRLNSLGHAYPARAIWVDARQVRRRDTGDGPDSSPESKTPQ